MEYNTRRKLVSSVIYIILALLIVAIMCIAILTMTNTGNRMAESETYPLEASVTTKSRETTVPSEDLSLTDNTSGQNPLTEPLPETTVAPSVVSEPESAAEADVIPETVPEPITDVYADLEFTLPTQGKLSKTYDDDLLVYSLTMNDYRVHLGVDIGSTVGAPVYACADGKIENIYDDPFMGKCITIDHGNGLKSHYKNLASEMPQGVESGMTVACGQIIAGIGETSLAEIADTVHLHFEMSLNGTNVNPLDYIPAGQEITAGLICSEYLE